MKRTRFPGLFWTGNVIEILERFAYYGLYMGFPIYATKALTEGEARLEQDPARRGAEHFPLPVGLSAHHFRGPGGPLTGSRRCSSSPISSISPASSR